MTGHPAAFSNALMPVMAMRLRDSVGPGATVLDVFAGTGRIHELFPEFDTTGVEIEPEWALLHNRTLIGDALHLEFASGVWDAICTSPTYGNRMADHHEAKDASKRITYRHKLGRALHPNNSGQLQWGDKYREFHTAAWQEAIRVLRPGGAFVLNIKDHVRDFKVVPVSEWHATTLAQLGLRLDALDIVPVPNMGFGANGNLRTNNEYIFTFHKPNPTQEQ